MSASEILQLNGWWQSLLESRDRLLASARFQRWAAAFPLTRFVARRRAKETFDLVAGFVYSQVLLACVRLNLFEILAEAPQTTAALAPRLALTLDATQRLIDAAVSLDLLEGRGQGRYGLGRLGSPLVGNKPIRAMIEHHALLYADLRDPVALLRGEPGGRALAEYWPYAAGDATDQQSVAPATAPSTPSAPVAAYSRYSQLMSVSQPLVADEVLDACSLKHHRCLLDVGGGDGSFLVAAGARYPGLNLMLFDLPPVVALASAKVGAAGMSARTTLVGGSFLSDPLPPGADVITFVRVIHDHNDERVMVMLRAAHRALAKGGTLLIVEPMAGTRGARAMGDAYFGFYLMAMGSGRPRTAERLSDMLLAAGFNHVDRVPTKLPLQASILRAFT